MTRTERLRLVLSSRGYLSSSDKNIQYYARRLLNVVDADEGEERSKRAYDCVNKAGEGESIDSSVGYRGPTTHGTCIGEGCYWHCVDQNPSRERGK